MLDPDRHKSQTDAEPNAIAFGTVIIEYIHMHIFLDRP